MRFDDMIMTVLDRPAGRLDQRVAQWRQLVDLLAQRRGPETREAGWALAFLRDHRTEVDTAVRARTAAALSGLPVSVQLVEYFSQDHPSVANAMLRGARLDAADWLVLLPRLTPTGRAVLRHRRDLPSEVTDGLAGFGAADFVLGDESIFEPVQEEPHHKTMAEIVAALPHDIPVPAPVEVQPVEATSVEAPPVEPVAIPTQTRSQILELVERIEQFQRNRGEFHPNMPTADEFRWETGPEGVILWVEGAPRGPIVGQSIAVIGEHGQHGVDGQAAGAYHKRAPFRDARLSVAGEGSASGDWRISGVPYFDPARGTFQGYRGTARRPRLDEVAVPPGGDPVEGLFGTGLSPDSLRQLIHELRTPLNAIIGFAEMIEGQYMGPAGIGHRGRAHEIVDQAQRLMSAVDDLDTAARIETRRLELDAQSVDAAAMLQRLHAAYAREAEHREAMLQVAVAEGLPLVAADASATERMMMRLLAATIGMAGAGETLTARLDPNAQAGRNMLTLAIDRPQAIAGMDEAALLQPGYSPDGDFPDAPALGLGFALRLVRKLAEAAGGSLEVGQDTLRLHLPTVSTDSSVNGGTAI